MTTTHTYTNTHARRPYTAPGTHVTSAAAPTLLAASGDDPAPEAPDVKDDIWADDIEML